MAKSRYICIHLLHRVGMRVVNYSKEQVYTYSVMAKGRYTGTHLWQRVGI